MEVDINSVEVQVTGDYREIQLDGDYREIQVIDLVNGTGDHQASDNS